MVSGKRHKTPSIWRAVCWCKLMLSIRGIALIFVLDNYDSFTYNLVQYIGELGAEVEVRRNDQVTVKEVEAMHPEKIVISPGPCTPHEAGISVDLIRHFAGRTPLLGTGLGHQAIGEAFGGRIIRAQHLMHGKTSPVMHDNRTVFQGLPMPMTATRLPFAAGRSTSNAGTSTSDSNIDTRAMP